MALRINIEIELKWDDIYRCGVDETLKKVVEAILTNSPLPDTVRKIMFEFEHEQMEAAGGKNVQATLGF